MNIENRIALGTVQLGLPYGVANVSGKPSLEQTEGIIEAAWNHGIRWFDTAQAYGESESILGHCFERAGLGKEARVVSKIHPSANVRERRDIQQAVLDSLDRLQVPSLTGFLLHREEMLDEWPGALRDSLLELKSEGLIKSLGVSVYGVDRALQALETDGIDLLQVPANVFDRRMARAGVFRLAEEKRKTVFVRSVYLQGLALMELSDLPGRMSFARNALKEFTDFCKKRAISRKQFAFAYVRKAAPNGIVVLGAETSEQVEENCSLAGKSVGEDEISEWDQRWPEDLEALVNPSKWPEN